MAAPARPAGAPPGTTSGTARLSSIPHIQRYVAIGDSSTEGLLDHDGRGGLRGWSLRLAERLAAAQGGLLYANLAVRGCTTRDIVDQQLARAIALRPDLATVFSGTNDVLRPRFDARAFAADVLLLQRELCATGATVLTFTLPDLRPLMPLARLISPRIRAMNEAVRAACADTGTRLVDFATHAVATDARLWNEDRVHANPAGHARIADALAAALALPGSNSAWREPLPAGGRARPGAVALRELRWATHHLLPWCAQALFARQRVLHARGRRPELAPVELFATERAGARDWTAGGELEILPHVIGTKVIGPCPSGWREASGRASPARSRIAP